MAKSYNVSFNILGNLDGSFLGALQGAARAMQNLGNFSRAMQERINKYSRMQTAAQGVLKNIDAYRALQQGIADTERQRAQELLNASRLERFVARTRHFGLFAPTTHRTQRAAESVGSDTKPKNPARTFWYRAGQAISRRLKATRREQKSP